MSDSRLCPVCSELAEIYVWLAEHKMYRCAECKTTFVHPVPSRSALDEFYYRFHLGADEGGWYDEAEIRMACDFPAKVDTIARLVRRPARILDVGCGRGAFVRACLDRDLGAEGIDISGSAVAYAQNVTGVPAHVGDLSEEHSLGCKYDCVTLWATIEHLASPEKMLKGIRGALKEAGYLVLDTGIGDDWLDRLLPGVVQWYDPPQHLFVFSREGISRLLEKNGFSVVSIDTCFERSSFRRFARIARGAFAAALLRAAATVTLLKTKPPYFTRFPVGNLMQVVAQRRPDAELEAAR
jgi:SAM-dependent methyltransferase